MTERGVSVADVKYTLRFGVRIAFDDVEYRTLCISDIPLRFCRAKAKLVGIIVVVNKSDGLVRTVYRNPYA